MDSVHTTVLPNEITVITESLPHVQSFSLGFWFNAGTRDETITNNGTAHFLEHMLFKGTKKRSAGKIARLIESYGGYLNAFTTKEQTCYYGRGLSRNYRRTFDVLSDMIMNPLFRENDINKERAVILDELRDTNDNPEELIFDKFEEALFAGNSLSMPVLGSQKNLLRFTPDVITGFYSSLYGIRNLLISASGNISHEETLKYVNKYLSGFALRQQTKRKPLRLRKSEDRVILKDTEQAYCIIGRTGYGYNSKKRIAMNLLADIIGEGTSSRLYQAVRERLGIAYQINSFVNTYYDTAVFGIYFSTAEKQINKTLQIIGREFKKIKTKGISKQELSRAKEYYKGGIILSLENTSNRMVRMASTIFNFKRYISIEEQLAMIDAVTAEDIMEVALELLNEEEFLKVFVKANNKLYHIAA